MVRKALLAVLAASLALPLGATNPTAAGPGVEPYALAQTATEASYSLGMTAQGTFAMGQSFALTTTSRLQSVSVYIVNPYYVSNMELLGLRQGNETDRIVCELLEGSQAATVAPRVLARREIAGFGASADWRTFTFSEQPLLPPGTYLFALSVTTGGLYGLRGSTRDDAFSQGRAYGRGSQTAFGPYQGDVAFGLGLTRGSDLLRESTPPVVAVTLSPPPNEHGWNSSPVAVAWTTRDPESGIVLTSEACSGQTLLGETDGVPLTCMAINGAGMRTSAPVIVRIDGTPPIIDASVLPPEEPDGWRYTETTVTFSAADQLSGVATVTPPVVLGGQGEGFSVTGTATDFAGNTASVTVAGINVWVEEPGSEPRSNQTVTTPPASP